MANKLFKKLVQSKVTIALVLMICLFAPYKTNAATLSFSPSSPAVSVGGVISMRVFVDTLGKYINNGEATIQFPSDMLEVVSVTRSSSIFSLWVEEPSFSNSTGKITFNGGIPNPGFIGQSGYIASIAFRAKKQGIAQVIFMEGAIRENDGLGTDILTSKNSGVVNIKAPKKIEVPVITTEVVPVKSFIPSIRVYSNQNVLKLNATKVISNIDYYTLIIDNNQLLTIKDNELINDEYVLPIQNEGSHKIIVIAYDKLGNYVEASLAFVGLPISKPILSLSSYEISKGDSVVISGKTDYPNKQINVVLELDGKEIKRYKQTTSNDGFFSITTDKMKTTGLVNIWAETIFSDIVKSQPSEKIYLKINESEFTRITLIIFYPLLGLTMIISLLIILLIIIYLSWHKFFDLKKRIDQELQNKKEDTYKEISSLREELNNQLISLEKMKTERNLSMKEETIHFEIKKNISNIDAFIEKNLKK